MFFIILIVLLIFINEGAFFWEINILSIQHNNIVATVENVKLALTITSYSGTPWTAATQRKQPQ